MIEYTEEQISYFKEIWKKNVSDTYKKNKFIKSLFNQVFKYKKLSELQDKHFKFFIDNGKTMYEAGILLTKS